MDKEGILTAAVGLFAGLSKTKEEAFLKGVLFGLGSHNACPIPSWELMKEYPESIRIDQEMRDMYEKIHKKGTADAFRLLALEIEGQS